MCPTQSRKSRGQGYLLAVYENGIYLLLKFIYATIKIINSSKPFLINSLYDGIHVWSVFTMAYL
jgi:hypothetical protein